MSSSKVFHAGEQAVHERFGIRERIEQVGAQIIRDFMPDQHRRFFREQPMLFVGSLDERGRPWASMLTGRRGFLGSPDPRHLRIAAQPMPGDPLSLALVEGASLGLLGIEPASRRRNRMNGRVSGIGDGEFTVEVRHSFGNCPKYIQARTPEWDEQRGARPPVVEREGSCVSDATGSMIDRADTFFIATATANASGADRDSPDGVDVSHRGGAPGFVRRESAGGATLLTIPDFTGNYMFNTLGNLVVHPRAGLLFVDFENGDLAGLTGTVEIVWDGPEVEQFAGAQRLIRVRVEEGWRAPASSPLRWSAPDPSPHLDGLGPWAAK